MKIKYWICVSLCLFALEISACGTKGEEQKPKPDPKPDDTELPVDEAYNWQVNLPPFSAEQGSYVVCSADRKKDAYAVIDATGFNSAESPDRNQGNHGYDRAIRHITQEYDTWLGKDVFLFHIHAALDNDRGIPTTTDRQRNEIKTDNGSPDDMKGFAGQTHHYRWKFRLPSDFRPTSGFCHIHQLKGVGGNDIAQPIITLTPRHKASGTYMQLIYKQNDRDGNNYLSEVPLSDFLGEWVVVDEWATFTESGRYVFWVTRLRDGKRLISVTRNDLRLIREGSSFTRPKYGIYRSTVATTPAIKDEIVRFADFELRKVE